jgi:hypothetical protein
MKQYGLPMDRETYLELAFVGQVPDELDPELEIRLEELFGSAK